MEPASQVGWEHELSQAPTCHSTWKTGPASVSCPWALSCTVCDTSSQRDGQEGDCPDRFRRHWPL